MLLILVNLVPQFVAAADHSGFVQSSELSSSPLCNLSGEGHQLLRGEIDKLTGEGVLGAQTPSKDLWGRVAPP